MTFDKLLQAELMAMLLWGGLRAQLLRGGVGQITAGWAVTTFAVWACCGPSHCGALRAAGCGLRVQVSSRAGL